MEQKYTGNVYLGVVGPEQEFAVARDSIQNIQLRPGDIGPIFSRGTKGFETRQSHFNRWKKSTEFLLLLDYDQVYPPDILERLRSHRLPYVSGYYMRRQYSPIAPVWFKPFTGRWPYEPWVTDPERGQLHELGASGWGCLLVHRDVVTAVEKLLKGEAYVIEDDMDIWPYDLQEVLAAIKRLRQEVDKPVLTRLNIRNQVAILEREIRVLRGEKTNVGSDIRFPFFANQAGFTLYGDPDARCGHVLFYPLHPDDFSGSTKEYQENMNKVGQENISWLRWQQQQTVKAVKGEIVRYFP